MKRIRPAPMGRAFRYQRRMAHIIVTVAEKRPQESVATTVGDETTKTPAKKTAGKRIAARKTAAKKSAAPKKKAVAKKSK
jgi:large subunit ribosomal protein L22